MKELVNSDRRFRPHVKSYIDVVSWACLDTSPTPWCRVVANKRTVIFVFFVWAGLSDTRRTTILETNEKVVPLVSERPEKKRIEGFDENNGRRV